MRRLAHLTYPLGREDVDHEQLVMNTILRLHAQLDVFHRKLGL